PLGVSQNESLHPTLESQSSTDENPKSQQALGRPFAHVCLGPNSGESSLNMVSFHLLGLPRQEFGEPGLRGLDDLFIQRIYEGVGRRIIERLENPLAMLLPQTLKHRKGVLSLLDDWFKRHHDLRDRRLQFKRSGFWVRDVCDHEVRQPGEQLDSLSEIL